MGIISSDDLLQQILGIIKKDTTPSVATSGTSIPSDKPQGLLDQILQEIGAGKQGTKPETLPSEPPKKPEKNSLVPTVDLSNWGTEESEPWRQKMVDCARRHLSARTPYQWGGGRNLGDYGLDCSGLVLACAREAGMPSLGMNSDMMYQQLPSVIEPKPGDLALYGRTDRGSHVRIVESWDPVQKVAQCIGAEGGNNEVKTIEKARKRGAFVKRVPHNNRSNFLGFRTLSATKRKS